MTDVVNDTVTILVDGQEVAAKPGEMIIAAAERAGVYIPRFCYHPRMRPVGMCRMCLVQVKGPRGFALQPACFVPVAEGQEVITNSPEVKKAQDGILEFLLVNHPLDCPVCDKGGECPLQDQTFTYGPGETRFVEEKRHWEKPIALSDLVYIDRERCIQCDRCTRFADEVAGDPLIEFIGRGAKTEVNTFPDQPFASYFSGNTVQICPVGALLSRPYRFKARPWDLEQVESTCTVCSVGCRIAVQSSQDDLTRYLGLDSDPVNHGWLCDKGRYSYEAVNSGDRLRQPMQRRADQLEPSKWADALDAAAQGLSDAAKAYGPAAVAVIGGARLPNEDQYAWAKLAKGVLGTDNVDAQLGDGLPADVVLGLPKATIDDVCSASAVILLTGDIKEELPVLYLRLRGAVLDKKIPLIEVAARRTGMTRYATDVVPYLPGEAHTAVRSLLDGDLRSKLGANPVVVLGRPSVAEPADSIVAAAAALSEVPGVRFLSGLRRGNVHGALDMGLTPGLLPGRVTLAAGRSHFVDAWGNAPAERGLDTEGILRAAADGKIHGLVLLGADPLGDFPDRELATRALDRATFVVAVDCFLTESVAKADVVLPAATFAERPGTTTNLEGRVTRLGAKVTAPDVAWPDWMIAVELAARLDADLGFLTLDEVWDEIERTAPAFAGITRSVLNQRAHRDGVVVPLGSEPPRGAAEIDASADPTSTPGVLHAETQGETILEGQPDLAEPGPGADAGSGNDSAEIPAKAFPDVPLFEWDRDAPVVRDVKPDAYALRLVAVRKLYDDGITVSMSPALSQLTADPVLKVNPHDLDRLGIKSGGTVRLRSNKVTANVVVEADEHQPRGSAALPFNVPGIDAGSLIDVGAPANQIGIETP
ncbi:MAG TPA: NADH-quinone oxidoreductase subunit NuoG [Acidimicrobiales bacterium]|jgi:NADH-quinone oxidoreductase subunit G|nr:NADH-quinone oxidoreductase subunit NuoG [Acidimicrobiales bacterium]